jgi:hypothetical protein
MGVGYVIGCLISILCWKLDRQSLFYNFNNAFKKIIKNKIILQLIYIVLILLVCFLLFQIKHDEILNFITAFLVIDISNTENKNLKQRDKVRFYDSISTISRALVCGFIAPLLFISIFGNIFGIAYMLLYNVSLSDEDTDTIQFLHDIFTIVPALIAECFLYVVYLCRNKRYRIDFKGDYVANAVVRPLLNVDIFGAYIESVNFYYLYSSKNTDYLKSYGEYTKKIDEVCVKDYLSIGYGICLAIFVIFMIVK